MKKRKKFTRRRVTERKSRMLSLYIVHFCMMIFSLGYSIVLTGVLPYLRRLTSFDQNTLLELFGWMVAINPIGQMLFSPLLGWLTTRLGSIRITCIITCLLYIVGNIIYSCLSLFPHDRDDDKGWLRAGFMLFGRLLVGIGTANQAPIRAYIAGATFNHERNLHISILSLFQTLGFMIGPALQSALTPIGCSEDYESGSLHIDMYTITGWLSAAVGIISLISFFPGIFTEHNVASKEVAQINEESNGKEDILSIKPDLYAVAALIFAFFVFLFNFILLETIGTPLCMQQLGWEESESIRNLGIIMAVGAVVSLICYASVPILTKKFDERLIYIFCGLVPMFLARILVLPIPGQPTPDMLYSELTPNQTEYGFSRSADFDQFGLRNIDCDESADQEPPGCAFKWCEYTPAILEVQFYIHYAMSSIAFPYCTAICQAMFSKVLGPRPQGTWMGIITAAGSFARILGPIFVSEIYKEFGTYWTYGLTALSLALATLGTVLTYRRLIPLEMRMNREEKEKETGETANTNL